VLLFSLYCAMQMFPKQVRHDGYDLSAFGAIPVLDGGRIKPLDSIARTNMLHISGRSEFRDLNGDSQPAILWLLQVLAIGDPNASPIADYEIFRVDNEQLLAELGLKEKPGWYRYSWNDLRKAANRFDVLYIAAQTREQKKNDGEKVADDTRDILHGKVIELAGRLRAYEQLANRATPTLIPKEKGSETWVSLATIDELAGQPFENEAFQQAASDLAADLQEKGINPQTVTPAMKVALRKEVERRAKLVLRQMGERERKSVSPAAAAFGEILNAYTGHRPTAFGEAIATYRAEYVDPVNPAFPDTTKFEVAFNAAAPFYFAAWMYIFAAILRICSWLGWTEPMRKAAVGLAVAGVCLNIAGLLGRMYLLDRPLVFVTNLYSSSLMIACGAVLASLYVERLFKNGIALVIGCLLGAFAVGIAHHLSTDGNDTLGKLQAVLDTNLWLASHVTTVTLGYSATFVAGLLGVAYIVWGLFFTSLTKERHIAVGNMIYGVTCFATMLSFIGTVLGGIWADQSWGRFWGWDPKENGAVLIVIWNSLLLHARWCGLVKQRGLAVLAVVGIMVTTWSWFGTNQLGVGLHAYGFSKALADGCKYTWIASLVVIGLGLIPLRYWRSFSGTGLPREEASAALTSPVAATTEQTAPTQPTATAAPSAAPETNGHIQPNGQPKPGKGKKHKKR
jgi:ABC-type transport system involved in cytochrome c biogenesis permease subunit